MKYSKLMMSAMALSILLAGCTKDDEPKKEEKVKEVTVEKPEKQLKETNDKKDEQDGNYKEDKIVEIPEFSKDTTFNEKVVHVSLSDKTHPLVQKYEVELNASFVGASDVVDYPVQEEDKTYVVVGIGEADRATLGGVRILDYKQDDDMLTVVYELVPDSEQFVDIIEVPKHDGTIVTMTLE